LVNLHGQHEAQTLLDPDAQRRILDAFAGATEQAAAVRDSHDTLSAIIREIADLTKRRADAERRADYLRHVVNEISEAKLTEGEDVRLEDEARRLENADELRSLAGGIAGALDGDDETVLQRLRGIARQLSAIQRIDPALVALQESMLTAFYATEALARDLEEYGSVGRPGPVAPEDVRRRRDVLFRITKKYGGTVTTAIHALDEARAELDLVDSADLDIRQLETRERGARRAQRAHGTVDGVASRPPSGSPARSMSCPISACPMAPRRASPLRQTGAKWRRGRKCRVLRGAQRWTRTARAIA
jgi:DNA repair protein RecN (Recombination protein N)